MFEWINEAEMFQRGNVTEGQYPGHTIPPTKAWLVYEGSAVKARDKSFSLGSNMIPPDIRRALSTNFPEAMEAPYPPMAHDASGRPNPKVYDWPTRPYVSSSGQPGWPEQAPVVQEQMPPVALPQPTRTVTPAAPTIIKMPAGIPSTAIYVGVGLALVGAYLLFAR